MAPGDFAKFVITYPFFFGSGYKNLLVHWPLTNNGEETVVSLTLKTKIKPTALAIGLAALLPLSASAADADTEARIQQLEQQVRTLLEKLEAQNTALSQQLNQQQQQINEKVVPAKGAVIATTNGRSLSFKSVDDAYSFQVGGRLQADAAFYDADDNNFGDGTAIRRLFLDVRGTFAKDWNYRFQYDFARPGSSDSSARGIRDAWIQYTGFGAKRITVGSFKEPFGLEHLTSGLYTTFNERGVTDLFSPDRHLGVGLSSGGAHWSAAVGVFGERPEGDVASEGDEGWDLTGRFSYAPLAEPGNVVHLGVAGRYHKPEDSTNELSFSSRPESNITGVRLIDTGVVPGVDDFQALGLEAAGIFGPFSVQAEYVATRLNRGGALDDVDLSAWYAYASFFLTGESRAYKADEGIIDRTRVARPVGSGGIGAWEVALRYSNADLSDANIIGGELENLTLGLNWYVLDNLRFSANYTHVLDVDRPGNLYDGLDLNTLTVRAQIDF